jgi:hypothetical protein
LGLGKYRKKLRKSVFFLEEIGKSYNAFVFTFFKRNEHPITSYGATILAAIAEAAATAGDAR